MLISINDIKTTKVNSLFIILAFILFIIFLSLASASCNSTQIDLNTASAEELDKIVNVGPVIAGRIIANRTYNSVDDLIKVSGIGDKTLAEIKAQGLACVEDEESDKEDKEETIEEEKNTEENKTEELEEIVDEEQEEVVEFKEEQILQETSLTVTEEPEIVTLSPIILNSKNIKSEENKEVLKRKLSFYGIITFCVIFGAWFLLNKEKNKNEFRQ